MYPALVVSATIVEMQKGAHVVKVARAVYRYVCVYIYVYVCMNIIYAMRIENERQIVSAPTSDYSFQRPNVGVTGRHYTGRGDEAGDREELHRNRCHDWAHWGGGRRGGRERGRQGCVRSTCTYKIADLAVGHFWRGSI